MLSVNGSVTSNAMEAITSAHPRPFTSTVVLIRIFHCSRNVLEVCYGRLYATHGRPSCFTRDLSFSERHRLRSPDGTQPNYATRWK